MWFNRLVIGQEDVDIRASYFADLDAAVMVVNIGDIDAMSQVQFSNITQEYLVIYSAGGRASKYKNCFHVGFCIARITM